MILAVALNPRPLNQTHVHDFDDTVIHLHVYIFYYNLVRDIPIALAIQHMEKQSCISLLKFVHLSPLLD